MKAILLAGSCSLMALASPALAQSSGPAVPNSAPGQGSATSPVDQTGAPSGTKTSTGAEQSATGVEDIIVTANRRNERQQDVPIAISTVTAASAEKLGAINTESLGIAVPALQFSRQTGNGGVPFLRGVGSATGQAGAESPVAVYVDDVYIGAPAATVFQFNNIDSIEVLKGPQGTLFGRNATGGVVQVHTRKPSQDDSLDMSLGYGSYNTYSGSLYATGGVTDTLALSLAAAGQDQRNGYGHNLVTGQDTLKGYNYGFRAQALWEPDTMTSLLLSADFNYSKGDAGQSVVLFPGTVGSGGGTFVDKFGTYDTPNDYSKVINIGGSGKLTHDFGAFKFVSITSYRSTRNRQGLDIDGAAGAQITAVNVNTLARNFSQELQVLSPGTGPFTWIVGAFYYRSDTRFDPSYTYGSSQAALGGSNSIFTTQKLDSYAGFGEATYEFLPKTKLTLGLRYTSDNYELLDVQTNGFGAIRAGTPAEGTASFNKLTYRAILDHKFTDSILAYASYSRGFKSGGYPLQAPTLAGPGGVLQLANPVSPEVLDAYEIGVKSDLFDRKVRFNVSAFHYDYTNLQVTAFIGLLGQTINAAAARINGADIDASYVPSRYLSFTSGFAFLDDKFTSFPAGPKYVSNPANCATLTTTGPLTGGNTNCPANLAGNRPSRAPLFTMSLSATGTLPTSSGDFSLTGSLYHNAGFFWDVDNRRTQPEYDLLGATLSWILPNKKYEIRAYARNLLNAFYYSFASTSTARDAYSPEMPRNYGVSVSVHL